jgi:hypothetical protein
MAGHLEMVGNIKQAGDAYTGSSVRSEQRVIPVRVDSGSRSADGAEIESPEPLLPSLRPTTGGAVIEAEKPPFDEDAASAPLETDLHGHGHLRSNRARPA